MDDPEVWPVGGTPLTWKRWERWLRASDPVGWVVAAHVVALVLTSERQHPTAILVLSGGLLAYRWVMKLVIGRDEEARASDSPARSLGSLALVGAIVGFDGGTNSPLFFSMLIVIVWETIVSPFRRFSTLGATSVLVYLGVVLLVPDINAVSLVRAGVLAAFLILLGWARGISEHWQRESLRAQAFAAEIADASPIGFAYYDAVSFELMYMNSAALDLGLDTLDTERLVRSGTDGPEDFREVRSRVATTGQADPPSVYELVGDDGSRRFIRIGIVLHEATGTDGMLLVYAEDVTNQVTVGEQHRRFLESANHQFRTPLAPILAYAELMANGELQGEELEEAAREISAGSQRIERLLDRISMLLRLEHSSNRERSVVVVEDLIDKLELEGTADLGPKLELAGDTSLRVRCDSRSIASALVELIDNSLRYGVAPVSLTVTSTEERVLLRLHDQGHGPDLDTNLNLGAAWSPISRPEHNPPGMGGRLGLAFAHTLAGVGGGSLRFERETDASWDFVLDLTRA